MKTTIAIAALVGLAAFYPTVRAQQAPRTVWDGVYSDAQAKRGQDVYNQQCAACHAPTLTGGESAPPLAGDAFSADWNDLSVADLFERIRISMPQDSPGRLSRQEVADVLAYILSANKFPAAQMELDKETEALKQIKYVTIKP